MSVTVKQFLDFRRSATALAFDRMIHAHHRLKFSHHPVDAVGQLLTAYDELPRYFHLDEADHAVIGEKRGALGLVINIIVLFLGRYSFVVSDEVARGELRPLRNPREADA